VMEVDPRPLAGERSYRFIASDVAELALGEGGNGREAMIGAGDGEAA